MSDLSKIINEQRDRIAELEDALSEKSSCLFVYDKKYKEAENRIVELESKLKELEK